MTSDDISVDVHVHVDREELAEQRQEILDVLSFEIEHALARRGE